MVTPGLAAAEDDAAPEAEDDACGEPDAEDDACGEPDADAPPRSVADVVAEVRPDDREAESVGDVEAPDCEPDPFVCGVGEFDGDAPLAVQAETATATRTAPAAERPTVSHAPRALPGAVKRIFMTSPRMRVR